MRLSNRFLPPVHDHIGTQAKKERMMRMGKGVRNLSNRRNKPGYINTFQSLARVVKKGSAEKKERRRKLNKRVWLNQMKRGKLSYAKVRQMSTIPSAIIDNEN